MKRQIVPGKIARGLVVAAAIAIVMAVCAAVLFPQAPTALRMRLEGYPESLVQLYERNPEAERFVWNYANYQGIDKSPDLSRELQEQRIPLFVQWDERWGYAMYGDDYLAVTGCGPTCLSMVACGLRGDDAWNPYQVAKEAQRLGYYVKGKGSAWAMMEDVAMRMGLRFEPIDVGEPAITAALEAGQPVICVVGPGDFTRDGHFIVLCGIAPDGVEVHDPNSRVNSEKIWSFAELLPQVEHAWAYSKV